MHSHLKLLPHPSQYTDLDIPFKLSCMDSGSRGGRGYVGPVLPGLPHLPPALLEHLISINLGLGSSPVPCYS